MGPRQGWLSSPSYCRNLFSKTQAPGEREPGKAGAGQGWLCGACASLTGSAGARRSQHRRGTGRTSLGKATSKATPVPCHPSRCLPLPRHPASAAGTRSSSGILGQTTLPTAGGKQSKGGEGEGATALEEAQGGQWDPRAGAPGRGRRQGSGRAASLQLRTVCPFPSWERQRGLSQIPVPRRGVKSRVFFRG